MKMEVWGEKNLKDGLMVEGAANKMVGW